MLAARAYLRLQLAHDSQTRQSNVVFLGRMPNGGLEVKRSWNPILWAGFALALASLPLYFLFLVRYQNTRESPWANVLVSAIAAVMLGVGIWRAYNRPQQFRGKVFGPILTLLSVAAIGLLFTTIYSVARNLPASINAPQLGQRVPDFTLPDSEGQLVTFSTLEGQPFTSNEWPPKAAAGKKASGTVLIFYRGYW